jgi:thioredoxin 1
MKSFKEIINQDKVVLVDFYATWCGPCKTMGPILENVKKKIGDKGTIIKIDVDKNQKLASELNISGVPTLIIYKNGKQIWRQSGVVDANTIEQKILSTK